MNKLFLHFFLIFLFISSSFLYATPINLTERDMYVREGFDKKWTISLPPENDSNWQKFPAKKDDRPVRVRQLNFKDLPKFRHFSLAQYPDKTFSFVTSFDLTKEEIASGALGLFLSQIGLNWEVYVNGELLKSEVYLDSDGNIKTERAVRSEVIELNHHFLRAGENILAYKIIGNPVDDRTGFFMKTDYKIDKLTNLKKSNEYVLKIMLIAVYLFFGIYHIFLFSIRRKEKYNFAYGAFAIFCATYWFCRTDIVFSLFKDSLMIKNFELVGLSMAPATFIALLELLVRKRMSIISRIWIVFSIVTSISIVFILKESLLRVTQVSIFLAFLYGIIYNIIVPFIKELIEDIQRITKNKKINIFLRIPLAFLRSLIYTIPGNLIIGIATFFSTAIIDILNVNVGNATNYSMLGFSFFVLGIAGILANRFVNVHNRMEELNISLEQKVLERTEELQSAMEELEAINNELIATRDALWGEMQIAKKIQTVLLPKFPRMKGYEIASHMTPANEVGGDYYDVINVDNHDWVVIGDVSGHGVPAGLIMMMVQTCIQIVLYQHPDVKPSGLLTIVNRVIANNIEKLDEDKYMTITVMACFKEGQFIHAGLHQDILIYRSSTNEVETVETEGMWLGLVDNVDNMMKDSSLKLEKNDVMLLYTDGITESWFKGSGTDKGSSKNNMFGEEKLVSILKSNGHSTPETIKQEILKELQNYESNDDVTLVVIKRL